MYKIMRDQCGCSLQLHHTSLYMHMFSIITFQLNILPEARITIPVITNCLYFFFLSLTAGQLKQLLEMLLTFQTHFESYQRAMMEKLFTSKNGKI